MDEFVTKALIFVLGLLVAVIAFFLKKLHGKVDSNSSEVSNLKTQNAELKVIVSSNREKMDMRLEHQEQATQQEIKHLREVMSDGFKQTSRDIKELSRKVGND